MVHNGLDLTDRPQIFLFGLLDDLERRLRQHQLTKHISLALNSIASEMLGNKNILDLQISGERHVELLSHCYFYYGVRWKGP